MGKTILETKNISKTFQNGFKAVQNLNLSVEEGCVFGFLGPNGAGKTTSIRMMLGLIQPDQGEAFIDGYSVKQNRFAALNRVGALVEGPAFYDYLSARENLTAFAAYSKDVPCARIEEVLEIVGLKERAKDKVRHYSYGMKQRLGIAQALLNKPKLVILDEPTNGLDPYGIQEIRQLIKQLSRETGVTIFLSSHILSEVEQVCEKVAIIEKGKWVAGGDVRNLLNSENKLYELAGFEQKKLVELLKTFPEITIIKELDEESGNVVIHMGHINPEDLLIGLVNQGARLRLFAPKKLSLEDFFFQVTHKGTRTA